MAQSAYGSLNYKFEFGSAEDPIAGSGAYAAAGTAGHKLGEFKVTGKVAETDTGIISISKSNGWARISGNNENGEGVAVGTEAIFSPTLNGPIAVECRLEATALTARVLYLGYSSVNEDLVNEPLTSTGTTFTFVASDFCGFLLDSQLTDATDWHMVFRGGTTSMGTVSTAVDADDVATAAESQVLRLEIDRNGTARWYIDGELRQTRTNAVSTTTLLAAMVGCWGTTTTAADLDLDYLAVEGNRDWTI